MSLLIRPVMSVISTRWMNLSYQFWTILFLFAPIHGTILYRTFSHFYHFSLYVNSNLYIEPAPNPDWTRST